MNQTSLKDVQVHVEAVLGERNLTVEDLASIGEGTIIELTRLAGDPIELKAEGSTVARGEVVVIDENFGIRITSIVMGEEG